MSDVSLRSSMFSLCNKIKKQEDLIPLRNLIYSLHSVPDGHPDMGRTDFGYIARHSHNQFYGYLFTDENVEQYKADTMFRNLTALSAEERYLIERGQATLNLFIERSLEEFRQVYPNLYYELNPYAKFKPIQKITVPSYVASEDMDKAVAAFKSSPAYKEIMSSSIAPVLKALSKNDSMMLIRTMSKELTGCLPGHISEDMKNYALRYATMAPTPETLLFHNSCLLVSLQEMLEVACQLIFTALLGDDLIILNNDNIISIEKNESNAINKYMSVLTQDGPIIQLCGVFGAIVLIDCDPSDNFHIHEFGKVLAETWSFHQDTGSTSKLTFTLLDEHLNPLCNLID